MRKFLISGNWKMQLDRAESLELAALTMAKLKDNCPAEVVLMPTFVHLDAVGQLIRNSQLKLGAQNVYFEKKGAFTGEISPAMLDDIGVKYVLVGHSERRHIIGEEDELLNKKAIAVITEGLVAVLCVGETLDQRQSYRTVEIVGRQLDAGLAHVSSEAVDQGLLVVAYEPVWAIGTGHTATPQQAQEVHKYIRDKLVGRFGEPIASRVRIQYGGSVKKNNAGELLAQPDIDGLLVGGASLIADEFLGIIQAAAQVPSH
ncbi:MAG TPA: triose-phosphate isomerase [Phycisphaerae bacterium]|nr:triose-phosphate isomerase [Phycisphaerae bacterium]